MCRLFGMSSAPDRVHATFWLLDAEDSLVAQSHREPDGTGLGYFTANALPRVDKRAIAAFEDRSFAREARDVESETFVAHIRFATTGGLIAANTHPFEQEGRLLAHNGVIGDLAKLEARLGDTAASSRATRTLSASSRLSARRSPTMMATSLRASKQRPAGLPGSSRCSR